MSHCDGIMQCYLASSKSHFDFIARQCIWGCKSIPAWLSGATLELAEYIELPLRMPDLKNVLHSFTELSWSRIPLKCTIIHSPGPKCGIISKGSTTQCKGRLYNYNAIQKWFSQSDNRFAAVNPKVWELGGCSWAARRLTALHSQADFWLGKSFQYSCTKAWVCFSVNHTSTFERKI